MRFAWKAILVQVCHYKYEVIETWYLKLETLVQPSELYNAVFLNM